MNMNIHGDLTPALEQHVRDRMTAALNQHDDRVSAVSVRLADLNGPKGGVDQQCRVTVRLTNGQEIRIDEVAGDMYAAVSQAADRVKHAAGRLVERVTERHTTPRRT